MPGYAHRRSDCLRYSIHCRFKCVRVTCPMPYSLVIFDLDGTLVDSFPWFRNTVNAVAARYRFRQVREEDVEMLRHASTREILDHLKINWKKIPQDARHKHKLKTA